PRYPFYKYPLCSGGYSIHLHGSRLYNVLMPWRLYDYMYLVADEDRCMLGSFGLFIIRNRSFS
ncbi:Inositol oxygenase, partial [Corchorus capsularis]